MAEFKDFMCQNRKKTCVDSNDVVDRDVTATISRRLARLTCKYQEHVNEERSSVVEFVKSPVAVPSWQIPKNGLVGAVY